METEDPERVAVVRAVLRPFIDGGVSDEDVMALARAMDVWSTRPVTEAAGSLLKATHLSKLDPAMVADDAAFAAELHFALHGKL
jgi:hypothetical protein